MVDMKRPDGSVAGVLAWYSLIHLDPVQVDGVLATIRRVMVPGGSFVMGFFVGDELEPFEHKVVTAYRWPADEVTRRLAQAGFVEVERMERAQEGERRPHGAIAARAAQARWRRAARAGRDRLRNLWHARARRQQRDAGVPCADR